MKFTKYIFAAAAMLTSLTACDSDLEGLTYDPSAAKSGELVTSATEVELTAATNKEDVLTLTWGKADFGIQVAPKYTVEMDKKGGDFSNPYVLSSGTDLTISYKGAELNKAILAYQLKDNAEAEASYDTQNVDVRVVASFSEDVAPVITNIVTLAVTPYAGKLEYAKLSVPGGHQGWDPSNYDQALYARDSKNPTVYDGYIYMAAGNEFKIADGSWDVNWGSSDGKTLEAGGANIVVSEAGCYYIVVDTSKLTISIKKSDWSIVGDAVGGWENDIELEYDADNNLYRCTYNFDGNGSFKFRANKAWEVNYGIDPAGEEGDLKRDGDDITALPGEYTVTLSFVGGYPTYHLYAGADIADFAYLNLPGNMNGWSPETVDNVIIDADGTGTYRGYIYLEDNAEFKIANRTWDINWGSSDLSTLVSGGDNIKPNAGAGMYQIVANPEGLKLTFTKHVWSIVGNAVGGDENWGTDYDLVWNPDTKCLEGEFDLTNGEMKFRANHDWGLNLGGNGEAAGLRENGDNIAITAGKYKVVLDLQTTVAHPSPTYSITKM